GDAEIGLAAAMRLGAIPQTAVTGHAAIDDALFRRCSFGRERHPAVELPTAEDRHRRRAETDREMRRAGLVGDNERRMAQKIEQLVERRRADEIDEAFASETVLVSGLRRPADEDHGQAALLQLGGDGEEILEGPAPSRLVGAEIDDRIRLLRG